MDVVSFIWSIPEWILKVCENLKNFILTPVWIPGVGNVALFEVMAAAGGVVLFALLILSFIKG